MKDLIRLWEPSSEGSIKGTIFIIHGMGEYSKRYKNVCNYLRNHGYKVAIIDHVGHGNNIKDLDELGLIKDKFKKSLKEITDSIEIVRDDKPLFILGHSMGSFMAQNLLERGIINDGIILSGSARPSKFLIKFGYFLSKWFLLFGNKRNFFLNKLVFGKNNLGIEGNENFRWLTRDRKSVKKYEEDPLCGFIPYTSYFEGLFYLIGCSLKIGNKKNQIKTPIYIVSGLDDPVGGYGIAVKKLYKFYKQIGYRDVTLKLYPKGRHEMLNEINNQEVYLGLLKWLDKRVGRG